MPSKPSANYKFDKKWGATIAGYNFTMVPNALIEGKHRLKISDAAFVLLMNLLSRWHDKDSAVFPSQETLGASMGKSPRGVQRALKDLSKVVTVEARRKKSGNYQSNVYSFDALIEQLTPIARDLTEKRDQARALRDAAKKPGFRDRKGQPRQGGAP
ncbi:MAG TPA: helix-turn-helix domain-containing protein [Polyangiales bacterium]|nr:helix-turn-helix domain-containing protein [Polyangiales bacterium]